MLLFLAFIISFLLIPLIIKISNRYSLVDLPNERKIHVHPVPRIGGLAFFLAFLVSFSIFIFINKETVFPFTMVYYFSGLLLIFITGFLDDIFHIRARNKLFLQIISALLVSLSGLNISELNLFNYYTISFGYFSYLLTIFWVVAFVNAINLMDGMDGLASGIVLIANIFIALQAYLNGNSLVFFITMALTFAVLGFYFFNFPPAKIFMGDGGAYFLGFMYATIPLMGLKKSSILVLFLLPFILLLVPLFDILSVMIKRVKLGYNIFIADKNHIHHRLLHLGFSRKGILVVVYTLTIILGISSIILTKVNPEYSLLLFFLISLIMFLFLYVINSIEKILENKNNSEKNDNEFQNK